MQIEYYGTCKQNIAILTRFPNHNATKTRRKKETNISNDVQRELKQVVVVFNT
jgi:hypothetical protein